MNKNEKNSIKTYDKLASTYDESFDGRFTAKFKEKMLKMCDVSHGDKVLDVGCGNGSLINAIKQKENVEAYGVDISPNMIAECKKQYAGINFTVSSGESLPFDQNSFNAITICCVLHHLHNAGNFIHEAHRVLQIGGIVLIGEPWLPIIIRQFFDFIFSPLYKAGDNKIFSHKKLKHLLTNNQFEIVEVYKKGFMQIIKARKI
jgi:ubiquinone/menaquinone biosynthesis C-methylase UbiE